MKNLFIISAFVLMMASFGFTQTNKSANSNKVLPPKTKLYPGLALDNRPPSSTMRPVDAPVSKKITPTSTPTPITTKDTNGVAGYQIKEGYGEEVDPKILAFAFIVAGFLLTVFIIGYVTLKNRARVRREKPISKKVFSDEY